jgi:gallate dioxygenase
VRKVHQSYYLPSMTGIATAIYENLAAPPMAGEVQRHRAPHGRAAGRRRRARGHLPVHAGAQRARYRLNRFLHG